MYIRTWTSLHCIQNTVFSKSFCIHLSDETTLPQNAVYILKGQSTYNCNDLDTARGNRLQHICHFDRRNRTQNACRYTLYLYEFQVTLLDNKKTTALAEYYMPTEKLTVTQISARYTNSLDVRSLWSWTRGF